MSMPQDHILVVDDDPEIRRLLQDKPFSARELLARIKVVLRPTRDLPIDPLDDTAEQLAFSGWSLDTKAQSLTSPDEVVAALSPAGYRLLQELLAHPNRALTRDQVLNRTRGREAGTFNRSVDVLIGRFRKHSSSNDRKFGLILEPFRFDPL